ncbi:MAG: pyridoxine 5'-phosphate synthase [Phycisphaeraceae bacterium]
MPQLGVNIDHVATIRQARRTYEPDPVWAAVEAQLGGADLITVHLREDRRHIQDHDVERIKGMCQCNLNLEMAATDEMVKVAARIKPHLVTLVPEGRKEVTTEGGLNVAANSKRLKSIVKKLSDAGIAMSAFIDAQANQIDAAAEAGFQLCEIHTGPYAHAFHAAGGEFVCEELSAELKKIADAGARIRAAGMHFNAGHALNYLNVQPIAKLAGIKELHIGHAIVSRAVFIGLREAVREMKRLIG